MNTTIEQIPKTALDIFKMLPEGTLCEVIDNVLYMSPAPRFNHQKLVLKIAKRLDDFVEENNAGIVAIAPVDVYFESLLSAVQPDIIFVSNENRDILHNDGYFYGAPDIVFEILSQDKKRDRVEKKSLYERAGVKEYFIIDSADKHVEAYVLRNGNFELNYKQTGYFKSSLLRFEFQF